MSRNWCSGATVRITNEAQRATKVDAEDAEDAKDAQICRDKNCGANPAGRFLSPLSSFKKVIASRHRFRCGISIDITVT